MKSRYSNYSASLLTNEQTIHLAQRVQKEIAPFTENSYCLFQIDAINRHHEHYTTLNNRTNDGSIAERTAKSDKKRRRYLTSLKRALEDEIADAEDFPQPAARAEKVYAVIEAKPVLHNISYDEESVQLKELFAELDKPGIAEEIEKLPAARSFYNKLKSEQNSFDKLREEKEEHKSTTPQGEIRVPIDGMQFHIEGTLTYLEHSALAGDEAFEMAANNLEQFTNELMIVARKRQTETTAE